MDPRQFLYRVIIRVIVLVMLGVSGNWMIDMYGLFRDSKCREISIYSDERTSKYLLAHRYVPENFKSFIIGPSLSANLDPSHFPDYHIYNLSMMGANITEQKIVLEKVMEKQIPEAVIICLHPYLTMDSGLKTAMINDKEYWGALGSFGLFKAYGLRIIRSLDLLPNKFPQNQFNAYGNNDYSVLLKVPSIEKKIEEELTLPNTVNASIDSLALEQFDEMINMLRKEDVKIVAYFHPLPLPIYKKYKGELEGYKSTMKSHLVNATIIDFTNSEYDFFSSDLTNYIDHGHLSHKGQEYLLGQIIDQLNLKTD